jgi:methionyl-tRNA formyltransferase
MKIALLTTDTDHHRYFINKCILETNADVSVLYETRVLKKAYRTGPFFEKEEAKFNKRFFDDLTSRALEKESFSCSSANSDEAIEWLKEINPDLGIVFGTGKIYPETFSIPRLGMINVHRGIIQKYRGLDSDLWAILNQDFDNIGVTIHTVDENLDTGDILFESAIDINNCREVYHIKYLTTITAVNFMLRIINQLEKNKSASLNTRKQKSLGKYYSSMPLEKKIEAKKLFDKFKGK